MTSKKDSILDLSKFADTRVRVKFTGGREVEGTLKGYDPMVNLVLDEAIEYLRDPEDMHKLTEETRNVGLVVCRGPQVVLVCPVDGTEEIANPFAVQEGAEM